jgi:hypothetical protein
MALSFAPASAGAIAASTKLERDDLLTIVIPLDLFDLGLVSAFAARESRTPWSPSGLLEARRPGLFCRVSS